MKQKINLRLIIISLLAIVATAISVTLVYYNLFQKQVRSDLIISAQLLKDTRYFESVDIDATTIDLSTDIDDLRVTWINDDGTVLYDNDADASALENHADRPEVKQAFSEGQGETVRTSDTMGYNTFYYAVLLDNGTVLRVSTKARSVVAVFFAGAPIVLLIVAVIIGICIWLSHVLTKQLIKPIEDMAEHIEDHSSEPPYKELVPFANLIRKQHEDILNSAKVRQDFTANVSHELKTPLTAISGYSELMENGMVEPEREKHFATEIRKNSERLLTLINDIIRLSELDAADVSTNFEEVDLNQIAEEAMQNLQMNAEKRKVALVYRGEPCVIRGNRGMLRELIENLVQNAIRYNNENGYVNVMVEKREGSGILTVKDNGIGIPESEQKRIFERFYRVDKSRSKATGGTGLGLAIVKHIVEIHAAQLELESQVGLGTTIVVRF